MKCRKCGKDGEMNPFQLRNTGTDNFGNELFEEFGHLPTVDDVGFDVEIPDVYDTTSVSLCDECYKEES